MKRVLIALLFILAWVVTASATQITVGSYNVSNWRYGSSAAKLRIYCNRSFQTSDGRQVNQGSPDQSGGFYLEVNVSVASTTATIASFTIDSTTDGINTTAARYTAYFYTTDGRRLGPFGQFSNFFISPDSGASQTWTLISLYNYNQAAPPDLRFTYDDATIERRIASINGLSNPLTTAGDIIIGTTGGALMRLGIGSSNQVLVVTGGLPAWQSLTSGQITTALGYTPLNRAGDTMTGLLVLSGAPTLSLHAATKAYVDGKVGNIAQINLDDTANQTLTVASSFSELNITDDDAGDHKFGLSGPIGVTHGGTGLATVASGSLIYASALNTLSALSISGSTNRVLRGGSVPAWGQVALTTDVTGVLPSANGGTGSQFFAISGPNALRTYTFPNSNATILTSANLVTAAQGGTGFGTGNTYTTGDIIYATGATALGKLALGGANTVLHGGASAPSYSAVDIANDTTGSLPISRGGTGLTAFGSDGYIKAASGALTAQAVPIPIADGGTNATGSAYTTNGVFLYTGSALGTTALGAANTVLTGTGSAPAFSASPTLTGLTLTGIAAGSNNSLVFANTSGALSADNTKLIWDSINSRLSVKSVLRMLGSSSGNVDLLAPSTGGALAITLPAVEGSLNQGLKVTASSSGAITLGYFTPLTAAITSINGQTNATQLLTIANTGSTLTVAQASDNENQIRIPSAGSGISAGLITNGTQSLDGIKSMLTTLHAASGTTGAAPLVFDCSSCAVLSSPTVGAMEYNGTNLFFTVALPSTSRKTVAFTDTTISDGQLSANVQLKSEKDTNSGYAGLNSSGFVPLARGGLGIGLTIGASGTFLRSDGSNVGFSADGSGLTGLRADALTAGTGAIASSILSASNALQTSDIGATSSSKAVAGLTNAGAPKLNLANMQEVMATADLSDLAGKSGSSGTFAVALNTGTEPSDGFIATFDATNHYWKAAPPSAGTATYLLANAGVNAHTDTEATAGAVTQGDLVYGNATPKWDRLPRGSNGTVLHSTAASITWALVNVGTEVTGVLGITNGGTGQASATAAFNALAPTTSKGDIIVHNGINNVRNGVGTNNNLLVADSAQPNGLKWAAVDLASSMVTGVLPSANGGLPEQATAGNYVMLPNEAALGTVTNTAAPTAVASQIRVYRFYLDRRLIVRRISFSLLSTPASVGRVGIGIYDNSSNLKCGLSNFIPNGAGTNGAGISTSTFSDTALQPGYYYLAFITGATSGITYPVFDYITIGAAKYQALLNTTVVHTGTAGNTTAATATLPSTLGSVTKFSDTQAATIPLVKLEY